MPTLTIHAAHEILAAAAAPWLQDLGLTVEAVDEGWARLRMPDNPRLRREGGIVSGQALMACADTAMIVVVASAFGEYRPMATVGQTISFMRPAGAADVIAEGRVLKRGRNLVFGEVTLHVAGSDDPIAHATSTYALLTAPR